MSENIDRVTLADVEARIARVEFIRLNQTVTVCHMTLDNGYSVRGESVCVDPRAYNEAIGQKLSRERALGKVWNLLGFLLAERRFKPPET